MAFRPKHGYNFKVLGGSLIQSKAKGTPGFQVFLEHEDEGEADYTIWLTAKNRDKAAEDFKALGVPEEHLKGASFVANQLPDFIKGREVYGYMVEEEYNNKTTIKVGSIGQKRAVSPGELASTVAAFFGAEAVADGSLVEDDIPF